MTWCMTLPKLSRKHIPLLVLQNSMFREMCWYKRLCSAACVCVCVANRSLIDAAVSQFRRAAVR